MCIMPSICKAIKNTKAPRKLSPLMLSILLNSISELELPIKFLIAKLLRLIFVFWECFKTVIK